MEFRTEVYTNKTSADAFVAQITQAGGIANVSGTSKKYVVNYLTAADLRQHITVLDAEGSETEVNAYEYFYLKDHFGGAVWEIFEKLGFALS